MNIFCHPPHMADSPNAWFGSAIAFAGVAMLVQFVWIANKNHPVKKFGAETDCHGLSKLYNGWSFG